MQTELKGYVEVQEDFKETAKRHIFYVDEVRCKAILKAYEKYKSDFNEYAKIHPTWRKIRRFLIEDYFYGLDDSYESFQEWNPDPWFYSPYKLANSKMQNSRHYAEKLSQDQFWKDTKKTLIPLDIYTRIVENQL